MITAVFLAYLVASSIAMPLPPPPHVDPTPHVHLPPRPSNKVGKPLIQPFEHFEQPQPLTAPVPQVLSTPVLKGSHASKRAAKLQDPPPGVHVDPRPTIFSIKPKPKINGF